jgi:hypothetical protein
MRFLIALVLCACILPCGTMAQLGRRAGGQRVNMQNRSTNVNHNYNNNTNVNRNVNVNVNNNYHGGGCYNCGGYYHDNDWNWGSFAAGAAVGVATTAVVAAATRPAPTTTTVVVQAPAVGTMVTTLPGGCSSVSSGGTTIFNCSSVYYRPYYQGTQLVYEVVTHP